MLLNIVRNLFNNNRKHHSNLDYTLFLHTGVYKEVITMVLDTLRQAIFSTTLTSNEGQSSEANYLPYFEMVFR